MPSRQILIYPATGNDHSDDSPFPSVRENGTDYLLTTKRVRDYMELYRSSDADLMNPYYAPLAAADFSNQPDTLIITAEYCPLRDEGEAYGKALAMAGNRVKVFRMPAWIFLIAGSVFPGKKGLCADQPVFKGGGK